MDQTSPRFANRLPKGQELVAMAEAIEALINGPGWGILVGLLEEELGALNAVLDGQPLEHVKYAHLHGQRRGVLAIEEAVQTVLSKRDRWLEEQAQKHEGAESPER